MTARPSRLAVSLVVAAAVLAASFAALAATSPGSERRASATGVLRVGSQLKTSNSIYVEGAYEYVTLRLTGTRALVLKHRYQLGKIKLTRRLPARSYRLASWTQTCSGNCGHLDPPAYACGRTIRVRAGRSLRATVVSKVGETCKITVRAG